MMSRHPGRARSSPRARNRAGPSPHGALDQAVRQGLIVRNPVDAVTVPSGRGQGERRALEDDEIALLLAAADGGRQFAPIAFLLQTGMREGELLRLKWADVDLDAQTVTVQRGLVHVRGKGLVLAETKTGKSRRTIGLSPATVALLRKHRARQAEERLKAGAAWSEQGFVFPTNRGTAQWPRTFLRDVKKVVGRSEIADPDMVTVHCLRHTAAMQWIKAGADIHTVSRRLGHASASFTMDVYGHLLKGMQRTVAEALDHLIG